MNFKDIFFLFCFLFFFAACSNDKEEQFENTFPFAQADQIQIVSYPNRNDWDLNGKIIENGKLALDPNKIVQKVVLATSQSKKLFTILYCFF